VHTPCGLRLLVLEHGPVEDVIPLVRCRQCQSSVAWWLKGMRPRTDSPGTPQSRKAPVSGTSVFHVDAIVA
jgi:hypothetical protein